MEQPDSPQSAAVDPLDGPAATPVAVRYRHDGWIPDRQLEFIEALAESGCVDEAARSVGMSRSSAYALRRRPDAQAFRLAWDAAMDQAVERLSEAALGRAINGVAVPIFFEGQQVGERRTYNDTLAMFILRYRQPARYGRWIDSMQGEEDREARTEVLNFRIGRMIRAAWRAFAAAMAGEPAPKIEPEPFSASDHAPVDDGSAVPRVRTMH